MTLFEQIRIAAKQVATTGADNPKLEAEVLAAHCLVKDRSFVLAHGLDELELPRFDHLVTRRSNGEPLAYIIGWREFYSRRFIVTPDVLIPRHETETLVDTVLATESRQTVLDIGTGSGCIAITLALESPDSTVTAVDVSPSALNVAKQNAKELTAEVELIESDLFSNLQGRQFDVIVSNPPYVAYHDTLATEVKDHEPHLALFADEDGYAFYRRLARECAEFLSADGSLILELGDTQADGVKRIFVEENWNESQFVLDLQGIKRVAVFKTS